MTKIKLEKENVGTIIMTQQRQGGKVKIEVHNLGICGGRGSCDTLWTTIENANTFYKKRIADGYKKN